MFVFSESSMAPCGVVGPSVVGVTTDELEWLFSEIGLAIVSDEAGDTLGSCTSSRSST